MNSDQIARLKPGPLQKLSRHQILMIISLVLLRPHNFDIANPLTADSIVLRIRTPSYVSPTAKERLATFDSTFLLDDKAVLNTVLSNVNKQKRFDAAVGIGYGFVSTGDIGTIALTSSVGYRISPPVFNFALG